MTPTEARALADEREKSWEPTTSWEDEAIVLLRSLADQVEALQGQALSSVERERVMHMLQDLHMTQTINNQNYSNDWHEAVNAAITAIRELDDE